MAGGLFDGSFGAIAYLMVNATGVAKTIGHVMQHQASDS
jgi:hypothetical protein